jgi:hypothetical protein
MEILFLLATEHMGLLPVLQQFLKKISSSAPGSKNNVLKISVWKLYDCQTLPAAKFIQLVSLFS